MKHIARILALAFVVALSPVHAQDQTLDDLIAETSGQSLDDLMSQHSSESLESLANEYAGQSIDEIKSQMMLDAPVSEEELADMQNLAFQPDATCALYMCPFLGMGAISDPTCQKGWKRMAERIAENIVKFWEPIAPIEPYFPGCVVEGSDPNAQALVRSYSRILVSDPIAGGGVVIEPGRCTAADESGPSGMPDVMSVGDCYATLTTYHTMAYGNPIGTLLHANELNGDAYIQDRVTLEARPVTDTVQAGPIPQEEISPIKQAEVKPSVVNPDTEESFQRLQAMTDKELAIALGDFTMDTMISDDGYFSAPIAWGSVQMYRATGDSKYMDAAFKITDKWISSGKDADGDGYPDWWAIYAAQWWKDQGSIPFYNYGHHELRAGSGVADVLIEMLRTGYQGSDSGRISRYAGFLKKHLWDKWSTGHNQSGNTFGTGALITMQSVQGVDFVGRAMITAMALDQAGRSGVIPKDGKYMAFVADRMNIFIPNYINSWGTGQRAIPYWIGGDFRGESNGVDTGHTTDLMYAIFRSMQVGYRLNRIDEMMAHYLRHVDDSWFPNSKGWYTFANGTGGQNNWNTSRAHGQALAASQTSELLDRWVDFVFNNNASWSFYSETGNSHTNSVFLGGSLMWALRNKL